MCTCMSTCVRHKTRLNLFISTTLPLTFFILFHPVSYLSLFFPPFPTTLSVLSLSVSISPSPRVCVFVCVCISVCVCVCEVREGRRRGLEASRREKGIRWGRREKRMNKKGCVCVCVCVCEVRERGRSEEHTSA